MVQALSNAMGFIIFVLILVGAFWLSAIFAVILFGVLLTAYIGLRVWAYLVRQEIVNSYPDYSGTKNEEVIDVEFTRVEKDKHRIIE